jgi:DNA-binding response OmpR family regulator
VTQGTSVFRAVFYEHEILKDCFELAGFSVEKASDGREAFQTIKSKSYECILSDICIPGGDVLELAQKIYELRESKPKLFLVTRFSEFNEDKVREWGVLEIFEKPFDLRHLLRCITEAT